MKTTNEILEETGITYPMLNRLKELGIIRKPTRKGLGRRRGVIGVFDDEVVNVINWVKLHQQRGLTLAEIANIKRKELAEVEVLKPEGEYLIPLKSEEVRSFLDAYEGLHDWLQNQIQQQRPGYELYGLDTERIVRGNKEFLRPREIHVRPKVEKNIAST